MAGRILIVDEMATHRIFLRALLGTAGYEAVELDSSGDVLPAMIKSRPELIILDEDLVDPNCTSLCTKIRRNPSFTNIPIIILSNTNDPQIRLDLLLSGADEVLLRPVTSSVLSARIRNLRRVAVMSNELKEREATAHELGLCEPRREFQSKSYIVSIEGPLAPRQDWLKAATSLPNCDFTRVSAGRALQYISGCDQPPDVIVLTSELLADRTALNLIAEMRCRSETRYVGMLMAHDTADRHNAIAALDMGANDLIEDDSTGAEFQLRIDQQLRLKRKSDQLRGVMEKSIALSVIDPLTGLYNRRYALPHLARIDRHSRRSNTAYAVMILDIDRFKRINDDYGHISGDQVLVEVARRLKSNLRSIDLLARIGGEEFMIVLPDTTPEAAQQTAERLRKLVAETPISVSDFGQSVFVTISIGMTMVDETGDSTTSTDVIYECADRALLSAKSNGRNTVEIIDTAA